MMKKSRSRILSLLCIALLLIPGCGNTAGKADKDGNKEEIGRAHV